MAEAISNESITKLVKQLGSRVFTERQAATKSLEAIGIPCKSLGRATGSDDAELALRARNLVTIIENSLDQLLAEYRRYKLPLPPKDALLVRFESGGHTVIDRKLVPTYSLGFLIEQGSSDNLPLLLVGTKEYRLDSRQPFKIIEANPANLRTLELRWSGQSGFTLNVGLVIALQCKGRGWNAFAQELWTEGLGKDGGHHLEAFYHPADLPDRSAVALLAWDYSENELVRPDTDRAKTAKRMRAVLAAEAQLEHHT